jgi:hypothetical protein
VIRPLFGLLLVPLLSGCKDKDPVDATDTSLPVVVPWHTVGEFSEKPGSDGLLDVLIEVAPGQPSFMVSATAKSEYVGVERVLDPSGTVVLHWEDWWYSDLSLTEAIWGYSQTTSFNWPIREVDGDLTPGTWTVELFAANGAGNYVDDKLSGTTWLKDDDNLSKGVIPVHIIYAKGTASGTVKKAVNQALDRWREIWEARGLTLEETIHEDSDIDPDFNFIATSYYTGSTEIEAYTATLPPGELAVFVGDTIAGDSTETYGIAGGIPGSLDATPMSWVVISWLAHASVDGAFDDEEIRIMGETMAHEVGHYSGLFHPVECPYECSAEWDALDDTLNCGDYYECADVLGSNVMFPFTVCPNWNSCTPAGDITDDQAGVWHRYTGTR